MQESLTLRYFPDMVRDYNDIALAQQSRGLDLSKKEKIGTRIKNVVNICIPLIFSTLMRIEIITNAMDLWGFGKYRKRTWYSRKKFSKATTAASSSVLLSLWKLSQFASTNYGRFWNPGVGMTCRCSAGGKRAEERERRQTYEQE